mmetsp:Transcript_11748/g.17945  ORF Transcript_11748/g.17945 Transcript_11748/m.17945 type:complete len:165 (+) Transcript_11748:36-530(+)
MAPPPATVSGEEYFVRGSVTSKKADQQALGDLLTQLLRLLDWRWGAPWRPAVLRLTVQEIVPATTGGGAVSDVLHAGRSRQEDSCGGGRRGRAIRRWKCHVKFAPGSAIWGAVEIDVTSRRPSRPSAWAGLGDRDFWKNPANITKPSAARRTNSSLPNPESLDP